SPGWDKISRKRKRQAVGTACRRGGGGHRGDDRALRFSLSLSLCERQGHELHAVAGLDPQQDCLLAASLGVGDLLLDIARRGDRRIADGNDHVTRLEAARGGLTV